MASATLPPTPSAALASEPATAAPPGRGWFFGPWFDALLVANVAWPLAVLALSGDDFGGTAGLHFWQLYYVTTPHRWVTLLLVFLDREQFGRRPTLFLGVAAAVLAVCAGVRLTTGALTCLLAVDYVWNAWHFASQHHGIYRIYGRLAGASSPSGATVEKWALRGFVLYVIARVATATWPESAWEPTLGALDWAVAAVPALLVLRDLRRGTSSGRLLYLVSMTTLYLALLAAVHQRRLGLVLTLATASALFHATEYLALVSWSVRRRHAALAGRLGWLAVLAPRWGLTLAVFVLVLGAGGWLLDQHFLEAWLTVNVAVAFLHYAYDGLIWRRT